MMLQCHFGLMKQSSSFAPASTAATDQLQGGLHPGHGLSSQSSAATREIAAAATSATASREVSPEPFAVLEDEVQEHRGDRDACEDRGMCIINT